MRIKTLTAATLPLLFTFFLSRNSLAQVKISEFLANNVSVNPDNCDYDDFTDWVELRNTGSSAADIGGYYMTGNIKNPKKWQIPAGTTIPANGYLLIWCDSANAKPGASITAKDFSGSTVTAKRLHAGFKLSKAGEQLGLFTSASAVVDTVTYGKQYPDVSMGRTSEGTWAFFDQPTPGRANSTASKPLSTTQTAGEVTFSIAGGFYSAAQTVTLTAADGSDIYYTTDYTIPQAGKNGTSKYSAPVSVTKTTAIRARCATAEKFAGKVISNTYFIADPHKLMTVSVVCEPNFLFGDTIGIYKNSKKGFEVPVSIEFFTTDGKQVVRANAGLRLGSITNFTVGQKPLQVALRNRYGDPFVNYRFFAKPITKFDRFRLRDGGDVYNTSLINDALLDPVCTGQTAVGIQAFRLTVLYINGVFYGMQDLREQFKDMYFTENYGIADPTRRDEVRSQYTVTGGFGKTAMGMNAEHWELVNGTWDSRKALVNLVKSGTVNYEQFKQMADVSSFADCFILYDFAKAISWGHNQDLWKVPEGKMRWLVTDFDRGWVYQDNYAKIDLNGFTTAAGVSPKMMDDTLLKVLVTNTDFKNFFIQRYAAHLNSTFATERLNAIVDSIAAIYRLEIKDHVAKWSTSDGVKSVANWENEITTIKKFMTERPKYAWAHLESAPFSASGGKANLSVNFSNTAAQADVVINGVPMCMGSTGISMYKNIPFTVAVDAKPGWKFSGWTGESGKDTLTVTLTGDKTLTANFNQVAVGRQPAAMPVAAGGITGGISAVNGMVRIALDRTSGKSEPLNVSIFDQSGRMVENLLNSRSPAGALHLRLTSRRHAPGIYCCVIRSGGSVTSTMVTTATE
jgi:uncharacterized repeat protein (TIGR02543 family)